ncbi:MAG: 5'-3' exonuclease H3TH domain-containing protein [Myxococcota bacterium]|nr:flap endonuclease [Deltaproteobacteria bacterium]MCP4242435.1 flap endonuclease [bacterium]MDP6075750.1 5'-3' exonuclease H3TH domain-containing protein [Myxococcota bacterium]MBT40597.1 flap endonuclease [Deltaproteobacteria bacterium]MDP6242584.1 5'-3' exonuclease H3TH domain-containing protein [Myxococcota bacterium]
MAGGPLVHLIDGPVWVFRAYYALPEMKAPDGTPTNAAYGYTNTLLKYLTDHEPTHLAVAFDYAMESFRNEEFPDYKAQRGEVPDDLEPQWDLCTEATRALGIPALEVEGYEADDVIATCATQLVRRGASARVVTTDKDLAQLVREDGRVTLWDMAKEIGCDADGVRERFGVDPAQIPDYLGLMGDSVDNLPGVPGVGPKTAAAALRAFRRIEEVPADSDRWAGVAVRGPKRVAGLIDAHREQALRTRDLATLVRDVPGIRALLREMNWVGADRNEVETLFEDLGWGRIATRVPRWAAGKRHPYPWRLP